MPSLEERITLLEAMVAELRDRLDMEAGLAASRDRDTSEVLTKLRAHERSLAALRETQVGQGQKLDRLVARVDQGFTDVERRFDAIDGTLGVIIDLLGRD